LDKLTVEKFVHGGTLDHWSRFQKVVFSAFMVQDLFHGRILQVDAASVDEVQSCYDIEVKTF
jgi:hypothetical protein